MQYQSTTISLSRLSVHTGVNVIESVGYTIQLLKEFVRVSALRLRTNAILVSFNHKLGVHGLDGCCCSVRLEFLNVLRSEEELSVEIRLLDRVHVRNDDLALAAAGHAHHGPVLKHLAANCACTHLHQPANQTVTIIMMATSLFCIYTS